MKRNNASMQCYWIFDANKQMSENEIHCSWNAVYIRNHLVQQFLQMQIQIKNANLFKYNAKYAPTKCTTTTATSPQNTHTLMHTIECEIKMDISVA